MCAGGGVGCLDDVLASYVCIEFEPNITWTTNIEYDLVSASHRSYPANAHAEHRGRRHLFTSHVVRNSRIKQNTSERVSFQQMKIIIIHVPNERILPALWLAAVFLRTEGSYLLHTNAHNADRQYCTYKFIQMEQHSNSTRTCQWMCARNVYNVTARRNKKKKKNTYK